jgi:hypothetical protein
MNTNTTTRKEFKISTDIPEYLFDIKEQHIEGLVDFPICVFIGNLQNSMFCQSKNMLLYSDGTFSVEHENYKFSNLNSYALINLCNNILPNPISKTLLEPPYDLGFALKHIFYLGNSTTSILDYIYKDSFTCGSCSKRCFRQTGWVELCNRSCYYTLREQIYNWLILLRENPNTKPNDNLIRYFTRNPNHGHLMNDSKILSYIRKSQ